MRLALSLRPSLPLALLIPAVLVMAACGGTPPPAAPAVDAARAAEAAGLYAERCASCHGADGAGDGAAGQVLTPRPRDFTVAGALDARDDGFLTAVIVRGGGAVGLSPAMPSHADLGGQPELTAALIAHLRAFAEP